jgi:transposase InsO family protein
MRGSQRKRVHAYIHRARVPAANIRNYRKWRAYLCAVKDLWSRRIVGYSIDSTMTSHLAVDALAMAVTRRGGPPAVAGCTVHSDRGSSAPDRSCVS